MWAVDVEPLLPDGSRVVPGPTVHPLQVERGDGTVRTDLIAADVADPILAGAVRLDGGSLPDGTDSAFVTTPLAERLGLLEDGELRSGATITTVDGVRAHVTGFGVVPSCLSCQRVYASTTSDLVTAATADGDKGWNLSYAQGPFYLVDLPDGTDVDTLWPRLAREDGLGLIPRIAYEEPHHYGDPSQGQSGSVGEVQAIALVSLVIGLGLLEVVLLAGTAFAVGARRQVRDLGLVAVAGGTARDVRRVVLAQGLVLGLIGAVGGIVVGGLIAVVGRPFWERMSDQLIPGWRFGAVEILIAAGVGLLSGLAAAVVPAYGAARMNPVDALARRFRSGKAKRVGLPVIGLGLIGLGVAIAVTGDRLMADDFAAYARQLEDVQATGDYIAAPSPAGPVALVLAGLVLVVAGLVVTLPTLVSLVGQLGRLLPLSSRLAFRDAARHRHRTGPATSAIAIAVAGSVAIGIMLANLELAERLREVPPVPDGVIAVLAGPGINWSDPDARADSVDAGSLAGSDTVDAVSVVDSGIVCGKSESGASDCNIGAGLMADRASCETPPCSDLRLHTGDSDMLALMLGREPTNEERAALSDGGVVVTDPGFIADGRATVVWFVGKVRGVVTADSSELPAVLAERDQAYNLLPSALVSPETVEELGGDTTTDMAMLVPDRALTDDEVDRLRDAAEATGAETVVADDFNSDYRVARMILVAAGAFITIVGVAIAVALSAAEGRADLATLAAVGAAPSRRRRLSAAQALLVGGLGCLTGLAFGMFAAWVARATTGSPRFVIPWDSVALTAIAVPLFAALVAAVVTPSRLPLVRRVE